MTSKYDSEPPVDVDRLLSGGPLSGPQYDPIADAVLARTVIRRRARWLAPTLSLAALAAAASVGLFLLTGQEPTGSSDTLRAKGPIARGASPGTLEIGCAGRVPVEGRLTCPFGSTLTFSVNAAATSGYLSAFAQRVGDTKREPIWYFPSPSGDAPLVSPGEGTRVLDQGARLGAPHEAGTYAVTVILSDRPLSRTELLPAASGDRVTFWIVLE